MRTEKMVRKWSMNGFIKRFLTVSSICHPPSPCKRCDIFAIQRDLPKVNHDTLIQEWDAHPKLAVADEVRSLKA